MIATSLKMLVATRCNGSRLNLLQIPISEIVYIQHFLKAVTLRILDGFGSYLESKSAQRSSWAWVATLGVTLLQLFMKKRKYNFNNSKYQHLEFSGRTCPADGDQHYEACRNHTLVFMKKIESQVFNAFSVTRSCHSWRCIQQGTSFCVLCSAGDRSLVDAGGKGSDVRVAVGEGTEAVDPVFSQKIIN